MKGKRLHKQYVLFGFLIIFLGGTIFSPFSQNINIYAAQETTSEQQNDSNTNLLSGFWDWVTGEKEEVNKITLNKESLQIEEGKTETLTATTDPEDVSVSWSSSNSTVATVNSNGKITAKSVGTAVITATAGELSVTCNVTVTRDTSTDSKQLVYFYSIYPGISTPGTGDNFQAGEWLYAGTGYANLPSISKVGEGYAITGDLGITDVPTDYYNKTITINGIQYRYDKDDTNDYGTFDIVWDKASVTSGANNSQKWDGESGINGSIIEGELCWHIDGHLVLHDEHMINVDFRLKDVGEEGFNSIRGNRDSYPYMCVKGTTIDEIRMPSKQNIPASKKKNNMTYVFDGWYTDEKCTQKADFSNPDMEVHEDVTYYGQYVIKQARITTNATHATVTESAAIPVGSNKTVFWEPEEGYLIDTVKIDEQALSLEEIQKGSYTFTDIQTDHTVEVIAKIQTFAITTKATNATISESIEQAEYGSTHLIEWQAEEGYYIDSVEIDGKAIEITDKTSGQYEFTNIHEAHTVVVKAKQYVYSITTQASHATITESESNIPYGESRTVSWKAEDGYEITSVVIDDVAQPIENKVEGSTIFEDIQANHTVVVDTKPYSELYFYNLTTSAQNAQVTPSETNIPYGTEKTVTWTPNTGYHITNVLVDNQPLSKEEIEQGFYTFDKVTQDHSVQVVAEIDTFTIETKGTNVTITPTIEKAEYGQSYTITWTPNAGHTVQTVKVDGKELESISGNSYTFESIRDNHSIEVLATINTYEIITEGINVDITNSEKGIPYGESRTIEWEVQPDHYITSYFVDGIERGILTPTIGHITFDSIDANHSVRVEATHFSKVFFYDITTQGNHAKVTETQKKVPWGESRTITWEPEAGYHITSVIVDGTNLSEEEMKKGEYTFTEVKDNHSVVVNAEINTYRITTAGEHVDITPSMDVSSGNSSTITWTAHEGYYISKIIIDGKEEIVEEITATGSHTFENITANHSITIETKPFVYSIQTSMTGGTITESMENVGHGSSQTIEWKADENHEITSIVVDGVSQEITNTSEGAITFENVRENHTVEVTAQPFSDLYFYNILTSATNSAVTESKENLPWGSSYTISWKPAVGYHIVGVMVDEQPLTNEEIKAGKITFEHIQANHTVHVTSAINTYQIETSGENVTIDPASTVEYGKDQTVSFTANEGYYIDSILVDNQPITIEDKTKGSYTFTDVKENHTIAVHASLYTYDIHTEINNGIITEDIQDVDYGSKQTIIWKANEGYHITSVLVNGEPIEVTDLQEDSYTFEKMTQDSSVVVQTAKNFTITTQGENVTITDTQTNILPKEEREIKWTANDGYYISSVIIDGHSTAISDLTSGLHIFSDITENHTIEVKASKKFSITTQGANVMIDDSLENLSPNSSHTITWKAQDGYYITEVLIDGEAEEITDKLQGEYTFEAIQGNHSVVVKASKCFDILTEISHGTIDDSISNILPGENHEIHYAPEEGYYISEVIIDGKAYSYKEYPESVAFKDVSSSHSIKVVCEPLKTVTTEIENGEITKTITGIHPDTDTKIIYKAFDDYYIYSVTVDGKKIDVDDFKEGSYSFKPTEKDHTITVVCQPKPTIYTSINNGDITSTFKVYPEESGTIQATPKEGHYIHRVTLDGEEVTFEDETKYELTIDNITKDHHIDVETTAYPDLEVKIFSNEKQYNYQDTIHYTIEATQLVDGTYGENLVITNTLPKGLTLDEDSIQVKGLEEDSYQLEVKDNAITLQSKRIDSKVSLEYDAKISSVDLAGTTLENKVSATMDRVKEEQTDSVKNKVLKPEVEISKTVVQEKYNVDDWVEYQIEVRQTTEGAKIQDIVIEDVLPEELKLDKDSIKVEGISEEAVKIRAEDQFLHCSISALNETTPVTIRFKAQLSSDCMGKTLESVARLMQKDFNISLESPVSIQVYQPDFKIEQYTDKKSYKEKDVIRYTIIAEQIEEGAVGKNVRIFNEIPEEILVNEQSAKLTGLEADTYSLTCDEKQLEVMIDEMQEGNPVTISFTGIVQKDTGTIENTTTLTSDTTKDKQYNVETEVEVKPEAVAPEKPNDGTNDGANDGDSTIPPDMNTNSNSDTSNHPNSDKNGRGEDISEEIVGGNKTTISNGGYRTSPHTGLQVNGKPFAIGGGILCIVAILLFAVIRKRKE